MLIEKHGLVM